MVRTNKNVSRKRKNKISKNSKKNKIQKKKIYNCLNGGSTEPLITVLPPLVKKQNFFEPQQGLGCGRHSLNNLLENTFFIKGEENDPPYNENDAKEKGINLSFEPGKQFNLRRFCKYLASSPIISATTTNENYCPINENYDVNILLKALNFCGFEVAQLHDTNTFISDDGNGVIGYIINYGAWHWVALRYNKDAKDAEKYELVDSMVDSRGNKSYFADKATFDTEINMEEEITNTKRFKIILKVYNRNIQITSLDNLSQIFSEDEKIASQFNYNRNEIYNNFVLYFSDLLQNNDIKNFLINVIKSLEGIEDISFFQEIFNNLKKKEHINEEIIKISKCITEVYNSNKNINVNVSKNFIQNYEKCITQQSNLRNKTIHRQPKITSGALHTVVNVNLPATPITNSKPKPIITNEQNTQLELLKKQFPIRSLVKAKKNLKNENFYAQVLKVELIHNQQKLVIGFKKRDGQNVQKLVNPENMELLNEDEKQKIQNALLQVKKLELLKQKFPIGSLVKINDELTTTGTQEKNKSNLYNITGKVVDVKNINYIHVPTNKKTEILPVVDVEYKNNENKNIRKYYFESQITPITTPITKPINTPINKPNTTPKLNTKPNNNKTKKTNYCYQ